MIHLIISGGQTGADQAALRAAKSAGISTGGTAPKGWLTEAGPAPWLADFGLTECAEPGYPARTKVNAFNSDATLWFGDPTSRGGKATSLACAAAFRHFVAIGDHTAEWVVLNLEIHPEWRVVNVAGNRESVNPGIGEHVELFLGDVFRLLRKRA